MTALKKYQKLESSGLWRNAPDAQLREVAVAFGDASLVLSEPKSGSALTHWSLPAVERLNPGAEPAIYAPDGEAAETLEIEDPTMIGAIETVRGAIASARARPGRLRTFIITGAVLGAFLISVLWLPDALIAQTASLVPPAKQAEIGRMVLDDVTRLTGIPCSDPLGLKAEEKLAARVLGPGGGQILVVRDGVRPSAYLPGNLILLSKGLVEDVDGPDVASGFAIAEKTRATLSDPMVPILRHAGLIATFRLLTTGTLPADAVSGYGEVLLSAPAAPVPDETMLEAFRVAGIASSPFAYAIDPSGEAVLGLIEADPYRAKTPPEILPDGDWVSLQTVCQE